MMTSREARLDMELRELRYTRIPELERTISNLEEKVANLEYHNRNLENQLHTERNRESQRTRD